MEEVVAISEGLEEEGRLGKILFLKLESLQLNQLLNLRRFSVGDSLECPSLVKIKIYECKKMEDFINNGMPINIDNQV